MFDKEFYPTPKSLVNKIIKKLEGREYTRILDPSAGKGDLLFPIADKFNAQPYAIERNLELCAILKENRGEPSYRIGRKIFPSAVVLGHDWMVYGGEHYFDLIVMNPPFSHAEDHFMRAINLYPNSDIVCVIPNKEKGYLQTNKGRILMNMLEGVVEFEEYDNAFSGEDAERKTNVSILVAYILRDAEKKKNDFFNFDAEQDKEVSFNCVDQQAGLVKRDIVVQLVRNYRDSINEFKNIIESRSRLLGLCGGMVGSGYNLDDMLKQAFGNGSTMSSQYNYFVDALKKEAWKAVFQEGKFESFMTESVRKEFDNFVHENEQLSFCEENIQNVLMALFENSGIILKQNVENVFDLLTKYYDENRCHVEGWKTNDRWKVKKKFILPWIVEPFVSTYHVCYSATQKLHDIDVAMCSLTGKSAEKIVRTAFVIEKGLKEWELHTESEFFDIRVYKKGTGHFTFKDEDLWNIFNLEACKLKRWLPE